MARTTCCPGGEAAGSESSTDDKDVVPPKTGNPVDFKFYFYMAREKNMGVCDVCHATFDYHLLHNGFGDSAYAYSDSTCYTCLLDSWKIPYGIPLQIQKKITTDIETYLLPAPDGGHFRASAVPRCPHCNQPLDPVKATEYIEKNAEGTKGGWKWDRNWNGIYCIVIENRLVRDNWKV